MKRCWRKGLTVEEADVDAGVADANGQGFPDLEVGMRGILEVSGGRNGPVSGREGCFDQWGATNMIGISSNVDSERWLANIGAWRLGVGGVCAHLRLK